MTNNPKEPWEETPTWRGTQLASDLDAAKREAQLNWLRAEYYRLLANGYSAQMRDEKAPDREPIRTRMMAMDLDAALETFAESDRPEPYPEVERA